MSTKGIVSSTAVLSFRLRDAGSVTSHGAQSPACLSDRTIPPQDVRALTAGAGHGHSCQVSHHAIHVQLASQLIEYQGHASEADRSGQVSRQSSHKTFLKDMGHRSSKKRKIQARRLAPVLMCGSETARGMAAIPRAFSLKFILVRVDDWILRGCIIIIPTQSNLIHTRSFIID